MGYRIMKDQINNRARAWKSLHLIDGWKFTSSRKLDKEDQIDTDSAWTFVVEIDGVETSRACWTSQQAADLLVWMEAVEFGWSRHKEYVRSVGPEFSHLI